jgi:hypothetical protein
MESQLAQITSAWNDWIVAVFGDGAKSRGAGLSLDGLEQRSNRTDISTSSFFLNRTVLCPCMHAQATTPVTTGLGGSMNIYRIIVSSLCFCLVAGFLAAQGTPAAPRPEAAKKQRGERAIVALARTPSTRIVELPDTEILRRGNVVIAATLDGFLCYGTKVPRTVSCNRALKRTETEQPVTYLGRGYQTEDLPKEPISH